MLRLFQGRFVVHEGGNPSSFRNVSEEEHVSDGTGLYHIRGSNEFNTRAVQVTRERVGGWREAGRGSTRTRASKQESCCRLSRARRLAALCLPICRWTTRCRASVLTCLRPQSSRG